MKPCRSCGLEFEPNQRQIRKSDFLCKECTRKKNQELMQRRRELGLKVSGSVGLLEQRRVWRKRYASKPEAREKEYKRKRVYRQSPEEKKKGRARAAVRYALVTGRLMKKPCERCGNPNSQAHHEDYDKKLDVVWLCPVCHMQVHKDKRGAG